MIKQTWVKIDGGILLQDVDNQFSTDLKVVTEIQPTEEQKPVVFHKRVKYVKSNAISSFKRNSGL